MKTIAIHQPNYLPWLGFFYKIKHSDIFVILDNVDYQSGNASSVTNRTRIKGPQGPVLLTIPVQNSNARRIYDISIDQSKPWNKKHMKSIGLFYAKAPFYSTYFEELQEIVCADWQSLAALNIKLIRNVCSWLSIETQLVLASELPVMENDRDQRIIEICRFLKAETYLAGLGSKKYNKEELFDKNGIRLLYSEFNPRPYNQQFGNFIPGLSVIDAIMNCGTTLNDYIT